MPYCCEQKSKRQTKKYYVTLCYLILEKCSLPIVPGQKNFVFPVFWEYRESQLASNG